ncbi:hypothetical protein C8258_27270 [Nocardia sp. MDA0666]|uniref:hypothetical protein n=1 Tax=Nocardia sp. MDA0666 TaxID=2135448 RepID=UPI000D137D6B|nr:hypothetical protein [Nocardia sp. MDA0666]PSR61216.1 hypothetical protein C8258_27270 [Nocardia sp. MDA0666]
MSGKLITATPSAALLVEEIVDRYGSVEQFCNQLRRDLDDPTVQLPRLTHLMPPDGGHPHTHLAWSRACPERVPGGEPDTSPPGPDGPGITPSRAQPLTGEAHVRRRLWRRLLHWL